VLAVDRRAIVTGHRALGQIALDQTSKSRRADPQDLHQVTVIINPRGHCYAHQGLHACTNKE
jgi:hypothetical protein